MSDQAFSLTMAQSVSVAELKRFLLNHGQRPLLIYSCQLDETDHDRLFIRYVVGEDMAVDGTAQERVPEARPAVPEVTNGLVAPVASPVAPDATERPEEAVPKQPPEWSVGARLPAHDNTGDLRQLYGPDLTQDFVTTIEALSKVGLPHDKLGDIFRRRLSHGIHTFISASEAGIGKGHVNATASLILEQKFAHAGSFAGHIEDVAVHPLWQRRGLGARIMRFTMERAWALGCRKVTLNCIPELEGFYAQFGFVKCDIFMRADRPK